MVWGYTNHKALLEFNTYKSMSVKSPSNMGLIKKFFGRWYLQQPTAGGGKIHLQEPKRKKMILFGTRIWNPFLVLEKKTPLIFIGI